MRPVLLALLTALALPAVAQDLRAPEFSGTGGPGHAPDGLTDDQRAEVQRQIDANVADLLARGVVGAADAGAQAVPLGWPLRAAPGRTLPGYHGVSNFVDQTGPGTLRDYQCAARTYEGHRGIDYFTWPFGWSMMDAGDVEVVAAAPGVIVNRGDGQFDRSCVNNQNMWNAVYVRHTDGSVAWYGHLKNGSVTPRAVGESVAAGEVLGVVGSSGNSTGPHLHLELYNASSTLIEPHSGQCNPSAPTSWWAEQRPYYDSAVNALHTHSVSPALARCPGTVDTPNYDDDFAPGETVQMWAYYRDQLQGQVTTYAVTRPDGSTYDQWSHSSPASHYAASYWGWSTVLPQDNAAGVWTFSATFLGATTTHAFTVAPPVAGEGDEADAALGLTAPQPNPTAGRATLFLAVPQTQHVRVDVVDALGRAVRVVHDGPVAAGAPHRLDVEGEGLPSGAYFVRAEGETFTLTRRLSVTR